MVINGIGTVIFGQVIVLLPPSFGTPSNNCTGSFTVAWGAVTFATSYILQRRINGGAWETIYEGPNLSLPQTGLAVGSYEYQIIAVKGSKQSPPVASGAVNVLAQGNLGAPFRSGNLLIQQVRSGCSTSNNQIGKYGCTDSAATNYDASATINEGCIYPPIVCGGISPEQFFHAIHATSGTYTKTAPTPSCANGTSGTLIFTATSLNATTYGGAVYEESIISATYTATTITVTYSYNNHDSYWNFDRWTSFSWTGFQPN